MHKQILILCYLLIFFCCFKVIANDEPKFKIIVNSSTASHMGDLSKQRLRAIFALNIKYLKNGTPIKVFVLPNAHPAHKGFTKTRLGLYPYQLQRNWDRLSFSTMAITPTVVNSEEEMIKAIAMNEGAIGYITSELDNKRVTNVQSY